MIYYKKLKNYLEKSGGPLYILIIIYLEASIIVTKLYNFTT